MLFVIIVVVSVKYRRVYAGAQRVNWLFGTESQLIDKHKSCDQKLSYKVFGFAAFSVS